MSFFNKIKLYIIAHKVISAVVLFVVLYGGYWGYKKFTSTVLLHLFPALVRSPI